MGDRFVLTNPSFYTDLEVGDEICVLGDINREKTTNTISPRKSIDRPRSPLELELEKMYGNVETGPSDDTGSETNLEMYINKLLLY